MRRKPRQLSPEDRQIWQRLAEQLTPLHPKPPAPAWPRTAPLADPPAPRQDFRMPRTLTAAPGPRTSIDLAPDPMQIPQRLERRTDQRLRRGKQAPEARIDLHGMTADAAHGALRAFLLRAHDRGQRLVLVITGKGRSDPDDAYAMPARRGILRNAVPQWLAQPPLAGIVSQIAPAHQRHGGGGAYYVTLRKRR